MLNKPKRITQHFGNNKNALFYDGDGHTGLDYYVAGGVGAYLHSLSDGEVIGKLQIGEDPRVGYWELRIKWEHEGKTYRLGYGHVAAFCVEIGDKIKKGQIIAIQGNGGNVASGGVPVSKEDRLNGSRKGAHVHFSVKEIDDNNNVVIKDGRPRGNMNPYQFMEGNDLNVNEKPEPKHAVLRRGDKGDDVRVLQTLLKSHGHQLTIDGDYGPITEANVKNFQSSEGLLVDGVTGPVTWAALLNNE